MHAVHIGKVPGYISELVDIVASTLCLKKMGHAAHFPA